MKWPYHVGTKVKITEAGHRRYGVSENNPRNTVGVVVGHRPWEGGLNVIIDVQWPGYDALNDYREGTLSPINITLENK